MEPARTHSVREYAALEDAALTKSELVNGQIIAMSGASKRHNAIAANVLALLGTALRGSGCRPYTSDQRVHVLSTDLNTYPDITVMCGPPQTSPDDRHAVVNPALLVEVLSPSTEDYDRGAKWQHYQQIASLREYVLVASTTRSIERYVRQDDGSWRYEHVHDGVVQLASCRAALALDDVYEDIPAD